METPKVIMEVGDDGVALLTINNPPVNSIGGGVMSELSERFEEAHRRTDVKAIVLTGANNKFSAGADIKSMSALPERLRKTEVSGVALMNNVIEGGPKPAVAAITGFALGGGLELAMACHARIAAPNSRLGLPELQLGIIPGLGGTQRLPRLVGVEKALNMMLTSKIITAEEAKEAGLVDAICESAQITQVARSYALGIVNHKYPFFKSLVRTDKLEPSNKALDIIAHARSKAKKTYKHVEHPFICLDAVEHGILKGGVQGTILERKLGIKTTESPVAKALMHVFLAERMANKVPGVTDNRLKARPIRTVGVVGGGLMGSGIATSLILHNIHVYLKEVDEERLQAAVNRIKSNLRSHMKKASMSEHQFRNTMDLLIGCVDYNGFDSVDLVIEAAVESIPLKKQIFEDLDKVCSRDCILASNTSSFDLDIITQGISCPERIIGAHFFSPAHIMRLLEIVRTEKTSKRSILELLSLSRTLDKVPVVVKNTVGFAVNRVFFPYHRMASFLVDLGVHPYRIDAVIKDFGMPIGPFRLGDLAGLQLGVYVTKLFEKEFGDRLYVSPLGGLLVKDNRVGESVGKGYYNYKGTRQEQPAPELDKYLEESRRLADLHPKGMAASITDKDIVEMIFFPIVNEACRVVDEKVVIRSSDLDIASVLGMGFPSFRGGILFWAESIGLNYILSKLDEWHSTYGSYFRPTSSLQSFATTRAGLNQVGASRL